MTEPPNPPANLIADPQLMETGANALLRGVQRTLRSHTFASLSEVPLSSGRRADVMAIDARSAIWIVEIKSSIADFRSDQKWPEYRTFCDAFYFAVAPDFPAHILPEDTGLILADAYGGEIMRTPQLHPLTSSRRKALVLSFGLIAARRLHGLADPPEPFT